MKHAPVWTAVSLAIRLTIGLYGMAVSAHAATFNRISPEGGLGRIEFQHLKANGRGDFVAVSNTQVFVGSIAEQRVEHLFTAERSSFVLTASTSYTMDNKTHYADVDVLQHRVAINAGGDFVLASNTLLWTGNTRTKSFRQIANAGAFAEFQDVRINDNGHYVAISYEKIFTGHVSDAQATAALGDASGNFSVYALFGSSNGRVDGVTGEHRLALNGHGRFVAITSRAVYHGDAATGTVARLHDEQFAGFRHVFLDDSDHFVIVTDNDVFAGNLAGE